MFIGYRRRALAITLAGVAVLPACRAGAGADAPVRPATTAAPAAATTSVRAVPGGPTIDGAATVTGTLAGVVRQPHDLLVPDGITATVTVTPDPREDVIISYDGLTFNDALFGEPEVVQVTGPKHLTFRVYSFFKNGSGKYSISVTS